MTAMSSNFKTFDGIAPIFQIPIPKLIGEDFQPKRSFSSSNRRIVIQNSAGLDAIEYLCFGGPSGRKNILKPGLILAMPPKGSALKQLVAFETRKRLVVAQDLSGSRFDRN
jgi:hypothetical protein